MKSLDSNVKLIHDEMLDSQIPDSKWLTLSPAKHREKADIRMTTKESNPFGQLRSKVENLIDTTLPEIIEIRRDIHRHPELGFEENRTSDKVASWLESLGIKVKKGVAGTGVIGVLAGSSSAKTIGLRADMDALPIMESTGVPYASTEQGRSHACGHDGHTAILLGTAKVLSALRNELRGNVKFIFQPAEEGGAGGERMCKERALEEPKVDAIFALHCWPDQSVGEIGVRYGVMLANTDTFEITVLGIGGHAARPHRVIDPIVMAAKIIEGFQTIISRRISALTPAIITVAKIQGGTTHNVIPDSVSLWGTVRTLDEETRDRIIVAMKRVLESTAVMFEAPNPRMEIHRGYPATVNDQEMVKLVEKVARELVGEVKLINEPSMGGEDFSFYLQKVPGAMFRLGVSFDKPSPPLHNAGFNFNDDAIRAGILMMTGIVFESLSMP
jgi:amidohydrolase